MANPMGKMRYDQTAITKFQASWVTLASNAMTESPATTSQITNDASANTCETISQIRTGLRETGFVCNAILLEMVFPGSRVTRVLLQSR
jgi:hypothetical protein